MAREDKTGENIWLALAEDIISSVRLGTQLLLLTRVKALPCGAFTSFSISPPHLSSTIFLSLQEYIYFVAEGLLFLFLFCFSFSFSGLIKHLDILWMEENCMPCPPPSPSAADIACNHELTRSNSNASALTAENCLDTYRRSENATPVTMIFPSSFLYVALRLMIFYFFYIFLGFRCSYLNVMMCW